MRNINLIFRGVLLAILGLCLTALLPRSVISQEPMQEKPGEFARKSLEGYVNNVVTEKNLANFGFESLEEARAARVGDPYQVMIIGLKDLKSYKAGTGARALLTDAKTLWFPVTVDGEIRTKLEIIQKDGKWVSGEFGGVRVPQKVAMVEDQLPKLLEAKDIKAPYELMLVRIPVLYATFLYIESAEGEFLVPTMVRPQRMKLRDSAVYTSDEVLSILAGLAKEIDENKVM